MRTRWKVLGVIGVFVAINVAMYLIGSADRLPPRRRTDEGGPLIPSEALPVNPIGLAGEVAAGTFTGPSMVSLEMRENVDFLLTPGLLVQQAITEGAIVTYPEE